MDKTQLTVVHACFMRTAHVFHTWMLDTQVATETRLVPVLHSCPLVLVDFARHFDVRVKWFCTREDKWTVGRDTAVSHTQWWTFFRISEGVSF